MWCSAVGSAIAPTCFTCFICFRLAGLTRLPACCWSRRVCVCVSTGTLVFVVLLGLGVDSSFFCDHTQTHKYMRNERASKRKKINNDRKNRAESPHQRTPKFEQDSPENLSIAASDSITGGREFYGIFRDIQREVGEVEPL